MQPFVFDYIFAQKERKEQTKKGIKKNSKMKAK
jgi:hypothetical protein